jgi:2-keto-4-pentenoate hydratase/2-oxohepta-3-ene-1,7-dioic acid hydratase in catechol pathway
MSRTVRIALGTRTAWALEDAGVYVLLGDAPWSGGVPDGERVDAADPDVRLLAPVAPSKVVGIGSNYRDHAAEMGRPVPTQPKIFLKAPSAIVGPGAFIELPPGTTQVDHEAELGVVIGRRATRVKADEALAHVYGYTVVNDVTARDFQRADGVFARAKGFDTFCPVGPAVVRGLDPGSLAVRAEVDGVRRQDGNTRDMVFSVAALVHYVSHVMTLEPGDLIATGTPAGVGPLAAGMRVTVSVEGIGALSNPVRDRDDR